MGESFVTQKDEPGIAHPDRNGHEAYATALATSFLSEPGTGIGLGAGLLTLTCLGRVWCRSRGRGDAAWIGWMRYGASSAGGVSGRRPGRCCGVVGVNP